MQIILQIITLVRYCSNSFQNLSLSDETLEKHSSLTNPTFECTTGDLNEKSVDETIKFQEKIKKIDKLCSTQSNISFFLLQIVDNYYYYFKLSHFRDYFESNSECNTEEQVEKEKEEKSEKESEKESMPHYQDLYSTMMCINDSINSCLSGIKEFQEGTIDEEKLKSRLKESKEEMLEHFNHAICKERIKEIKDYLPRPSYEIKLKDLKISRDILLFMLDAYKVKIQEILNALE